MPTILDASSLDFADLIRPGDRVMWGQAGAEPVPLTQALMAGRHAVGNFEVFLGIGGGATVQPAHADCIRFTAYCGTGATRLLAKAGKLDILPAYYSELPALIRGGALKVDVLMLQLAPPDALGRYSLGISHEYLLAALDTARVIIAEINAQAPWTYGERYLTAADLDYVVETARPPLETIQPAVGETERMIARHVAGLIEDGATLQFGLGALPEAILTALSDHRDLGIHSGSVGDGAAALMAAGVVTNARKSIDPGVTVAGIMLGAKRLYDFAHGNPAFLFRSTDYTHHPAVLARIEKFVALNSAIEVDLTGQINAETAGGLYVGAVGGAMDFLRAARLSRGGLPIVALPATAKGTSRIVAKLSGPVSTPRGESCIIVTEFGIADLRGLTLEQRVPKMIAIAHPDHREALLAHKSQIAG